MHTLQGLRDLARGKVPGVDAYMSPRKAPRPGGATGGFLHAKMEADLAREAAERPAYGTVDKTFFSFDFAKERHAFWTRVRGCAERLADTAEELAALVAARDAELAAIAGWVVGLPNDRGRIITQRMQAGAVARARMRCDAQVLALRPEPTRCSSWRKLHFYPDVLRKEADAEAFLDPHATPAECALALESGLVTLCGHYPKAAVGHPTLLVALVRHYVSNQYVPGERRDAKHARRKAKALYMHGFVTHLHTHPASARALPTDAVAALVEALRSADPNVVAFAARALSALPVAAVTPHAAAVSDAVTAQATRKPALVLVEALVRRVNAPENLNMAAELRSAMAAPPA